MTNIETIELIVSRKNNIERLRKVTDDPAFIECLLRLKGLKKMPSVLEIKIGIIKGSSDEEESGNTCGNCGKPDPSAELD